MAKGSRLPLFALVVGVFLFNMSEFMPIGILSDISVDLDVSESSTGLIISVYAWVVAAITLPVMLFFRNSEYKRLMLFAVAVFAFFQLTSALSNDYWMLMGSRLGVAFAHSIFWSIVTPMAVRSVGPEYHRFAISCVAAGTSIAMILGLPLGRMIGLSLGWRASFLTIAIAAIIVLLMMAIMLPRMDNPGTFTINRLPDLFRNRILISIYVLTAVFITAHFTVYGYIEPFLLEVSEMPEVLITFVLSLFGVAGILAGILFARYYDLSERGFMLMAIGLPTVCMLMIAPLSGVWVAIFVLALLWGVGVTLFNTVFQNSVIGVAVSDGVAIAVGLFSGIFNLGIGTGTMLGGIVTDEMGIGYIGMVGGAIGLIALAILVVLILPKKRTF